VVNASATVDLLCLAYGSTTAPSVEWLWINNEKTAIIEKDSVYSQRVIFKLDYYNIIIASLSSSSAIGPSQLFNATSKYWKGSVWR
jgi:hypothetical protein